MRGPGRHGLRRFGRRRYLFEIGQKYRSARGAVGRCPTRRCRRTGASVALRAPCAPAAERQYRWATRMERALRIRDALPEDAAPVSRIYIESWNIGFAELMPRRNLDSEVIARWQADLSAPPPKRWWLAMLDNSVVGFIGIGPSRDPVDPMLGELDTVAVDPPHWRTGVGRALMARALHSLSLDGYREAILWTLAGYSRGAAFYTSTGWRPNGAVRDRGRQVCYTHPLPSQ